MLLALDTATATASVAVYDRQRRRLLSEITWQARRRHTQDLMPAVQQALAYAGAGVEQITALAVTTGPGSFTGVRIGISAVKGLGLGMVQTLQTVGVPTLSVTAAPWLDAAGEARRPLRSAPSCRPVAQSLQLGLLRPRRSVAAAWPRGARPLRCRRIPALAPSPSHRSPSGWRANPTPLEQEVAVLDRVCCLLDGVERAAPCRTLGAPGADRHLAAGNEDDLVTCSRSTCRIPNMSASFPFELDPVFRAMAVSDVGAR